MENDTGVLFPTSISFDELVSIVGSRQLFDDGRNNLEAELINIESRPCLLGTRRWKLEEMSALQTSALSLRRPPCSSLQSGDCCCH